MEIYKVHTLLRRLGANATYKGFFLTAAAVWLCTTKQSSLLLVTKDLYPKVAQMYGTNWRAVERNIRTVSALAWEKNPALLQRLAGTALAQRPNASYFLAILSVSLLDGSAGL
ncbi:MAG: sporulation protein [Oscillibacter sp.]|nr:sporulation protein [Oscillibacter sp.]